MMAGRPRAFHNTNSLVKSDGWEISLSKTGYINEAGKCLVMQAWLNNKPMIIVLLDSFDPGWSATVDDVAAQIHTVDFALRGVVVPPGTHRVVFHYRPAAAWHI